MKRRNPPIVLLLGFVTLGIYIIYWLYKTRKEITTELNDPKAIPLVSILFAPWLFMLALCIIALFVTAITFGYSNNALTATFFILLFGSLLAGIIIPFFWFYKYSEALHRLVPETEVTMIYVLWVVMFISNVLFVWPLIVQGEINKYIDRKNGGVRLQPAAPSPQPMPVAVAPSSAEPVSRGHHAKQLHSRTHHSHRSA